MKYYEPSQGLAFEKYVDRHIIPRDNVIPTVQVGRRRVVKSGQEPSGIEEIVRMMYSTYTQDEIIFGITLLPIQSILAYKYCGKSLKEIAVSCGRYEVLDYLNNITPIQEHLSFGGVKVCFVNEWLHKIYKDIERETVIIDLIKIFANLTDYDRHCATKRLCFLARNDYPSEWFERAIVPFMLEARKTTVLDPSILISMPASSGALNFKKSYDLIKNKITPNLNITNTSCFGFDAKNLENIIDRPENATACLEMLWRCLNGTDVKTHRGLYDILNQIATIEPNLRTHAYYCDLATFAY